MVESSPLARYLAEFIGTYFIVFTVGCNVICGSAVWAPLSCGCAVAVTTYALLATSGAHLNPAVSVALGLTGKLPWREVGIESAVQFLAGGLASFSYVLLFAEVFTLGPAHNYRWWQAGLAEFFYTFMLCFVFLNVVTSKKHADKDQFHGLAVGFVVVAGGYGAGHISGGCFNPALALGIDLAAASRQFGWSIVYMIFHFAGAALAAALYHVCRPDDFTTRVMDTYPLRTRLVSEFIGTFMVVLTVGLNVLGRSPATAVAVAAALLSMNCALHSCSGAHFNPCVTGAIMASGRGKCTPREGGFYIASHLAGGVAGGIAFCFVAGGRTFALGPGLGFTWLNAGFAELVFTFLLCYVFLTCGTTVVGLSQYFGLAVGACVIAGGLAVGAVSGASLNPAVSAGVSFVHLFRGGGLLGFLLYSGAEVAGAALAALAFMATHPSEYKQLPS